MMYALRFLIVPFFFVFMVGCGSSLNTPPPLDQSTAVAITPFIASEKAGTLGKWVPINLTTRMELALKDTQWVYDQSEKVAPVASALVELGLTLNDIFADSALAAKVGQALKVDLIIIGKLADPKFAHRKTQKPLSLRIFSPSGHCGWPL